MRRRLAALAVVALVAVAGCAGGLPGSDDAQPSNDGDPLYETPLDATAVADAHLDAVADAGSYTIQSNSTQEIPERNRTANSSSVVAGDLSSDAVYTVTNARSRTVELYAFGNGTAYQRFVTGGEVQYRQAPGRVGNASQYARGTVARAVGLFEFSYAGTESADGETVHVYEAEGAGALNTSAPAFRQLNETNVDAVAATLRVREDGLVRSVAYDLTITVQGTTQRIETVQRFVDVGSTDTAPPAWIDEARANTSQ
jgi:hypothetical protein